MGEPGEKEIPERNGRRRGNITGSPGKAGYARGKEKEGGKKVVSRGKRDTREKWKKKGDFMGEPG